jgi:molybdate transport system substrate-binding protein
MRFAALALVALLATPAAGATTITVLTTGSLTPAGKTLAAEFTQQTGTQVMFGGGRPNTIIADLKAGAAGDVVLLPSANFATPIPRIDPASVRPVARIAIGVAVPQGAPLPDISTPEKFREALKAAKGVAYSDPAIGSSAGPVIAHILDGAAYAGVKRKPVRDVAISALASGEADIALQMITELRTAKTVQLVGPVPEGVGAAVEFSAATVRGAPPEAAAFVRYMARPAAAAAWKKAGVMPVK